MEGVRPRFPPALRGSSSPPAGCGFFFCSGNLPTLKAGHKGHRRRGGLENSFSQGVWGDGSFPRVCLEWSGAVPTSGQKSWRQHLSAAS